MTVFAEETLIAALENDYETKLLIKDKIFPVGGAQHVDPNYVTYRRVSTVPSSHLTGGGNLDQVRLEVGAWSRTALEAVVVADTIRTAIHPIEGEGCGTFQNQQAPSLDIETGHWGVTTDYFIWQERT